MLTHHDSCNYAHDDADEKPLVHHLDDGRIVASHQIARSVGCLRPAVLVVVVVVQVVGEMLAARVRHHVFTGGAVSERVLGVTVREDRRNSRLVVPITRTIDATAMELPKRYFPFY